MVAKKGDRFLAAVPTHIFVVVDTRTPAFRSYITLLPKLCLHYNLLHTNCTHMQQVVEPSVVHHNLLIVLCAMPG